PRARPPVPRRRRPARRSWHTARTPKRPSGRGEDAAALAALRPDLALEGAPALGCARGIGMTSLTAVHVGEHIVPERRELRPRRQLEPRVRVEDGLVEPPRIEAELREIEEP